MSQSSKPKLRSGGALTREQFLLRETRIVARMRLDGEIDEDILKQAVSRNIFQFPTARQARQIAIACLARLDGLGNESLVSLMAQGEGTPEEAAQCNLYAMARVYSLMRKFLIEEIGVRYRTLSYCFSYMDMNVFFTRLAVEDSNVATWSESTVRKLKTVLRSSLAQTGMLADAKSETLQQIYLCPRVRNGIIANGDEELLPAFNCMDAYRFADEEEDLA